MDLKVISDRVQKLVLDPELFADKKKFSELLEILTPYIKKVFVLYGSYEEDLLQDAIIIMMDCIKRYRIDKKASFMTYYINVLRFDLSHIVKGYEGKGVASGWTINHKKEANFSFENIDDFPNIESDNDFDFKLSKEDNDRLLKIFNDNVLDVAIHSAIEEFNLTREEVAELFCIPFTWIKSSRRRVRKIVARFKEGELNIEKY